MCCRTSSPFPRRWLFQPRFGGFVGLARQALPTRRSEPVASSEESSQIIQIAGRYRSAMPRLQGSRGQPSAGNRPIGLKRIRSGKIRQGLAQGSIKRCRFLSFDCPDREVARTFRLASPRALIRGAILRPHWLHENSASRNLSWTFTLACAWGCWPHMPVGYLRR